MRWNKESGMDNFICFIYPLTYECDAYICAMEEYLEKVNRNISKMYT